MDDRGSDLADAVSDLVGAVEAEGDGAEGVLFDSAGNAVGGGVSGCVDEGDRQLYERWKSRVGEGKVLRYRQTPSLAILHRSDALQRLVRGPVGSGKSYGCLMDVALRCMLQTPCRDGVVRNRSLFGRGTHQELKETTFDMWMSLFPKTQISLSPPVHGCLKQRYKSPVTGRPCDGQLQLLGFGMNQAGAESHVRSNPFSVAYLEEVQYIKPEMVTYVFERLGRYPLRNMAPESAGPGYFRNLGMTMNTNSSVEGDWLWEFERGADGVNRLVVVQPPAMFAEWDAGADAFRYVPNVGQRPGVWPAENVENLSEGWGYYFKLVRGGQGEEYIRQAVLNEYGMSLGGKAVFPEFARGWHVPELGVRPPVRGERIFSGMDFGRTPRWVLGYRGEDGQLRVFRVVARDDIGADVFISSVMLPYVRELGVAPGQVTVFGDPAGMNKGELSDRFYLKMLSEAGFDARPPNLKGNSVDMRLETVRQFLTRTVSGGKPMLAVDRGCEELILGLAGGYVYERGRGPGGAVVYSDKPDKRCRYSHVCDALQYLCVGAVYGGAKGGSSAGGGGASSSGAAFAPEFFHEAGSVC